MNRRTFTQAIALAPVILSDRQELPIKKTMYLKPGDRVGLICPAGIISEERLQKAFQNMESLGLVPVPGQNVLKQHGYFAGDDFNRLEDLHRMIADKSLQAIWCVRGGFGCTHLLPHIDYALLKQNPKPILGYSDVTAFHHAWLIQSGLSSFHSPVGASEFTPYTLQHLTSIIFGHKGQTVTISSCDENDQLFKEGKSVYERYVIHPGKAEGHLWGGNLSLLSAMAGTPYLKIKKDIILYIEDVDEAPYRMDRMLTQLYQSLPQEKIKGVIVGVCEGCEKKDTAVSFTLKEMMLDRIGQWNVPSVYGFPFGHINNQCTLPMYARAILNTAQFNLQIQLS